MEKAYHCCALIFFAVEQTWNSPFCLGHTCMHIQSKHQKYSNSWVERFSGDFFFSWAKHVEAGTCVSCTKKQEFQNVSSPSRLVEGCWAHFFWQKLVNPAFERQIALVFKTEVNVCVNFCFLGVPLILCAEHFHDRSEV